MMKRYIASLSVSALLGLSGLSVVLGWSALLAVRVPGASEPPAASGQPLFEEVAARAGVRFTQFNGATGKDNFVEFAPGGCAFLDYDNDGFLDILLLQSGSSDDPKSQIANPKSARPHCALYHNNGDGTFTDVTKGSGLDKDLGYALGVAVGDYDNDGYDDLFITGYRRNFLFHNEHPKSKIDNLKSKSPTPLFTDVTAKMGLDKLYSTGFATSAAFGDYDNDGRLDLYVCYYADWTWGKDGGYYSGTLHRPDIHRLYHNDGDRFTDVTEKAGIAKARGRGLAVAFLDVDGNGRQDIFVANDHTPNMLWHNNGNETFMNVAMQAGCAYGEGGQLMAGMCVATADYDHSGRVSVFVTNRQGAPKTLFKNEGAGLFRDVSEAAGVAAYNSFAFGGEFLDVDADGWPDLLVVNGMVNDLNSSRMPGVTAPQPKLLFHNNGRGGFREITAPALGPLNAPTISRGLAVGDYDNDGRMDALVSNQNAPAQLFHNIDRNGNHWVSFKTIGTKSNRDGLHAKFTLAAGGMTQTETVRAGSSYLSASDRRVYFGLGSAKKIESVEIRWPSGVIDRLRDVKPDAGYIVTEGRGITGRLPHPKRRETARR